MGGAETRSESAANFCRMTCALKLFILIIVFINFFLFMYVTRTMCMLLLSAI